MTERYVRVYTLKSQYYQEDSPVVLAAGALLKDTQKNCILAQLKFKSVCKKGIKALKVSVQPLSITGETLGDAVEHNYLDIEVKRDDEFGQKEATVLPDNNTRQFSVRILETVFEDGTVWNADSFDCEQFESAVSLEEGLGDDQELIKQYKLEYGEDSQVIPETHKKIWICTCGGINRIDEEKCHLCGKEINRLLPVDIEALNEKKETRLKDKAYDEAVQLAKQDTVSTLDKAKEILSGIIGWKDSEELILEYERRIEDLKDQMQKQAVIDEENRKIAAAKRKKGIMIGTVAALAIAAVAALLYFVIIPGSHINKGDQLLAEGQYDEAIAEYETAKNNDKVVEAKYQKAVSLLDEKNHLEAKTIFDELNGYKDSYEMILECKYLNAQELVSHANYQDALNLTDSFDESLTDKSKAEEYTNAIKDSIYDAAIAKKESGQYDSAITTFTLLESYKDSTAQIELCKALPFANAADGDHLIFGHYNNRDLEWIVLTREGDSILMITTDCVDKRHFQKNQNDPKYYVDSPIRKYLNTDFINEAFSETERNQIETHNLSTTGGDVSDQVFLLSDDEAAEYFSSNEARASADKQTWFLRTVNPVTLAVLNHVKPIAMRVNSKGEIYQEDWTTDYEQGIRPAIWLDVSTYVKMTE